MSNFPGPYSEISYGIVTLRSLCETGNGYWNGTDVYQDKLFGSGAQTVACNITMIGVVFLTLFGLSSSQNIGHKELVYQWTALDYDWPSSRVREEFVKNGSFVVENNVITGIKVYNGSVYVTVPRWKTGVPSTLNIVVEKNGRPILKPFPSWSMQAFGDCSAIQYSQSMEIDPATGWMWIIDTGNAWTASARDKICPAKLVIYDINSQSVARTYHFPSSVVPSNAFLNDIVLHKLNDRVALAYISEARGAKLVVYDFRSDTSYSYADASMQAERGATAVVHIGPKSYPQTTPIDGIAMSPDFCYVFYSPLAGTSLYRIPTTVLSQPGGPDSNSHIVRRVGTKRSQSDGMAFGKKNLYYSALSGNAVYKWDYIKDNNMASSPDNVVMTSQTIVAHDDARMKWIDTLGFDTDGYLWFTANDLASFLAGTMNFNDSSVSNMFIWKMYVNEQGYLGN